MTERTLPLLGIVTVPDPRLLERARDVYPIDLPELLAEAAVAVELMDSRRGVGLAWPQMGLPRRAFLFCPDGLAGHARLIVNPRWEAAPASPEEDREAFGEEGCFSVVRPEGKGRRTPEGSLAFLQIARPYRIRAWWTEVDRWRSAARARPRNLDAITLHGHDARVFQHEADHLDGVVLRGRWREVVPAG